MPSSEIIFPPMSGQQVDQRAYELIRRTQPSVLGGNGPFDIERFVDNLLEDLTGINPDYRHDLPDEIYGYTDVAGNLMGINANLIEDEFGDSDEKFLRSTLAHETGHCFIHVPMLRQVKSNRVFTQEKNEDKVRLYRKTTLPIYSNPEWQAHRFAGALLMPEEAVMNVLRKGGTCRTLAQVFQVHPAFVRSRLRALKIYMPK